MIYNYMVLRVRFTVELEKIIIEMIHFWLLTWNWLHLWLSLMIRCVNSWGCNISQQIKLISIDYPSKRKRLICDVHLFIELSIFFFFLFFYLIFPFSLWKTDNFNNDNSVIFFTSNRVSAVKSALYSMLTSAIPPLLARYEYFEALATEDILNVVCWFFFSLNSLSPVSFSIKSNCKIKCKIEGYT